MLSSAALCSCSSNCVTHTASGVSRRKVRYGMTRSCASFQGHSLSPRSKPQYESLGWGTHLRDTSEQFFSALPALLYQHRLQQLRLR